MNYLQILSQLGVMVFMFLIGLEVDLLALRTQGRAVVTAGLASILGPFLLALPVGWLLWTYGDARGNAPSAVAYILFVATTLCVSAFPVLARILAERNLHKTKVGALALACAAINDVLGWCILAVVFDIAHSAVAGGGSTSGALLRGARTALFAALYATFMIFVVRRLLARLQAHFNSRGYLSQNVLAIVFLLLLFSSLATQSLGIHLIFGAFMLGAVMPSEPKFVKHLAEKIEDFTLLFLLPIFFTYTGLKTDLTQVNTPRLWIVCGFLLLAACTLKIGVSALAARYSGLKWRPSLLLGVLMNTHGLMELIVVNLALELGAISPETFALLVVVLLATTILTVPLTRLLYSPARQRRELHDPADALSAATGPAIVVALSLPTAVSGLLRAAQLLMGGEAGRIYAVHLERPGDRERRARSLLVPRDPLEVAQELAPKMSLPLNTESFVSRVIGKDICQVAQNHGADWTLVGWHKPVFLNSVLAGTVGTVLDDAPGHAAILMDKGLDDVKRVLVPFLGEPQDQAALQAAERIGRNEAIKITILHVVPPGRGQPTPTPPPEKNPASDSAEPAAPLGVQQLIDQHLPAAGTANQVHLQVVESLSPIDIVTQESHRYDLIVLGVSDQWHLRRAGLGTRQESVAQLSACSLLIVRGSSAKPHSIPANSIQTPTNPPSIPSQTPQKNKPAAGVSSDR